LEHTVALLGWESSAADDGSNVYVDDVLVVNGWSTTGTHTGTVTVTAGQVARVRIQYYNITAPATLALSWAPPAGSSVLVPAADLSPNYGLVTGTHTDDPAFVGTPGLPGSPARTAVYTYATSPGDPLTTSAADGAVAGSANGSTITTTTDLLGRTLAYTDVWGTVTTTSYEPLTGRVTQVSVVTPGMAAKAQAFSYDLDGRLITESDGGKPISVSTYTGGDLTSVAYPSGTGNNGNGASVALARDATGAETGLNYTMPGTNPSFSDQVVRSQSGRILQDTITRAATGTVWTSTYSYDTAGRLVSAVIPHNALTYSYASAGGCGVNPAAGADGNRTGMSDSIDGVNCPGFNGGS
jgi:YD repeat-containing protein